jgi:hypothetical protein
MAKNIHINILTKDEYVFDKKDKDIIEVLNFEEQHIKYSADLDHYTFDALVESGKLFLKGAFMMVKAIAHMSMWAFAVLWEGIRWIWSFSTIKKESKTNDNKKDTQAKR